MAPYGIGRDWVSSTMPIVIEGPLTIIGYDGTVSDEAKLEGPG